MVLALGMLRQGEHVCGARQRCIDTPCQEEGGREGGGEGGRGEGGIGGGRRGIYSLLCLLTTLGNEVDQTYTSEHKSVDKEEEKRHWLATLQLCLQSWNDWLGGPGNVLIVNRTAKSPPTVTLKELVWPAHVEME